MVDLAPSGVPISWRRLADAMAFYVGLGYQEVDVPWWVSRAAGRTTCRDDSRFYAVSPEDDLVGSAEQGFLEMELQGILPRGRFVACTPCFRAEPVTDSLHQRRFMKVELYANTGDRQASMDAILGDAWRFMQTQVPFPTDLHRVPTEEGFDIELGTVEVGSYGVRRSGSLHWTYGTGVAEPRFSAALAALL